MLLGAIIETVSGQPYESYVLEHILQPLRMERTGFVYSPELKAQAAGSLPVLHPYTPLLPFLLDARALVRERRHGMHWLNRMYLDATPSSGLIGSSSDAARLMQAYLDGGELDSERVLPASVVHQMTHES